MHKILMEALAAVVAGAVAVPAAAAAAVAPQSKCCLLPLLQAER